MTSSWLTRSMLILCALEVAFVAVVNADCRVWNIRPNLLEFNGKLYAIGGWNGDENSLLEYDIALGNGVWADRPPSNAAPSVRSEQGFAESNGKLYVFGGDDGSYQNYLHVYDIASRTWTDLSSPISGTPPSGRFGMGFADSNGKLYVFGGSDESSHRQDLHEYDIASRKWTDLSSPSTGTPPSARTSMGLSESNGKLFVFGGYDGSNKNDLHRYDIASGAWSELSSPKFCAPRHRMGFAESNSKLYVFGGKIYPPSHIGGSNRGELHEYDIQTGTWTDLQDLEYSVTQSDEDVTGFAVSYGKLFRFALTRADGSGINLHVYDIASGSWTGLSSRRADNAVSSLQRCTGLAASGAKLYAFGVSPTNRLHEYNIASGSWQDLSSPRAGTPPSGYVLASTGLAEWNGKIYVFGALSQFAAYGDRQFWEGFIDPEARPDFHEYDIASMAWTDLSMLSTGTPPTAPGLRSMGFTASAGKLYVFGGYSEGSFTNDLNQYDISSGAWTDLSSPRAGTLPAARYKMGFTQSNGKLYVFGGDSDISQYTNDLHEYDMTSGNWTDLSFSSGGTPPSERYEPGFVESNGKLYVFSGRGRHDQRIIDLHEYDIQTGTWTDLSSPIFGTPPPAGYEDNNRFTASDGKLYLFRADGNAQVYEYHIASKSWTGWTNLVVLNSLKDQTDLGNQSMGEHPSSRAGMGLALSEDKLYIFGGYDGSYKNDLHQYEIASGSWADLSVSSDGIVPSLRAYMGFAEWDGKLYALGGQNGFGVLNSFWAYDIASGIWTDLSSPSDGTVLSPRTYLGFAKWNGRLYVYGGFSDTGYYNTAKSDLHEYDIASGSWTDLQITSGSFSTVRDGLGFAESDGKLYIFGRTTGEGGGSTLMVEYNIESRRIETMSRCGVAAPAIEGFGFSAWNGKLYVFGGDNRGKSDLHEYDISSGVWTDLSFRSIGNQIPALEQMGVAVSNGKVYVFGGKISYSHDYRNDLYVLNLDCTPDGTAGCFQCLGTGRGTSGNAPGSMNTPSPGSSGPRPPQTLAKSGEAAGEESESTAITLSQTPAPTSWQLEVLTTMVGMTVTDFSNSAQSIFKGEVSNLFAASTAASDITIVGVADKTSEGSRRVLLEAAIEVDYVIGGFSSASDLATAAKRIEREETQTYLAAMLRFRSDFSNLTSLVTTVSAMSSNSKTDLPTNTPSEDTTATSLVNTNSVGESPPADGSEETKSSKSTRLPIGAIVGGSFGALVMLLAAGFFCWVAAHGGGPQAPVIQVPTNRDDARFQA